MLDRDEIERAFNLDVQLRHVDAIMDRAFAGGAAGAQKPRAGRSGGRVALAAEAS